MFFRCNIMIFLRKISVLNLKCFLPTIRILCDIWTKEIFLNICLDRQLRDHTKSLSGNVQFYESKSSVNHITAVLVATSVDCERGFSELNDTKRDKRAKLEENHLKPLMRVSTMKSSLMEFREHKPVLVKMWRNRKSRRDKNKADSIISHTDKQRDNDMVFIEDVLE